VERNHADGTRLPRWHEGSEGEAFRRRTGSGRANRRTDGGDLEKETRRSRRMVDALRPGITRGFARRHRLHAAKVMQSSQRARVVGLVATPGGRESDAEAARDGGGTRRERADALGYQREYGKTSNARPATVKAKEEAGKANDSLPCTRRGFNVGAIWRLDT